MALTQSLHACCCLSSAGSNVIYRLPPFNPLRWAGFKWQSAPTRLFIKTQNKFHILINSHLPRLLQFSPVSVLSDRSAKYLLWCLTQACSQIIKKSLLINGSPIYPVSSTLANPLAWKAVKSAWEKCKYIRTGGNKSPCFCSTELLGHISRSWFQPVHQV